MSSPLCQDYYFTQFKTYVTAQMYHADTEA